MLLEDRIVRGSNLETKGGEDVLNFKETIGRKSRSDF